MTTFRRVLAAVVCAMSVGLAAGGDAGSRALRLGCDSWSGCAGARLAGVFVVVQGVDRSDVASSSIALGGGSGQ